MKIYISHSTSFDYERDLYTPIKNSLLYKNHSIVFPHERSEKPFETKKYFENCDLVIAEVSFPSTGQGIELGWADMKGIPIIAIYKMGSKISSSIDVISQASHDYQSIENIITWIEAELSHIDRE